MHVESIRNALHRQPFQPFTLRLADGREVGVGQCASELPDPDDGIARVGEEAEHIAQHGEADLQADAGTDPNSPLNPFLEKELLKDADLCMDGALFTRTTGFE